VLLVPVVLGVWALLCTVARPDHGYHPIEARRSPRAWKGERGVPFSFLGTKYRTGVYGFKPVPFVADLAIALATACVLAMATDRLILRLIRAARMKERDRQRGSPI
jgi:hypothetical protein